NKYESISTPTSINDWTLAALGATLDHETEPGSTLSPIRTGVAGFDLARYEHWGKPPSAVVKGLADHLVAKARANSEMAPIAAHLLLSHRAPAFLVKDIPAKVTYGSHTWVTFSTAVARIESQQPGSSSSLTFADVMVRADMAPISAAERAIEYFAQTDALKDWGVANGITPVNTADVYTDAQMKTVRAAFNAQITELSTASQAQTTPIPVRKEMALKELKRVYGDQIPFEEKCITSFPEQRDYPGPYSVLDLYLKESINTPLGFDWDSSNSKVSIRNIMGQAHRLENINDKFNTEFLKHLNAIEKSIVTQVKYLISIQPLEIRKNFEFGKITIVREDKIDYAAFS
ncbi:MAG: hypothetical protein ACK8QZ_12110, partial [Anaerolineales bacterium]